MSRDEDKYASKGVAGTALGVGIGGLALALLNGSNCGNGGGLLGGLLGGNNNCEQIQRGQRAETELAMVNQYFMPTWREMCDLKSEVAVNKAVDAKNQEITGLLFRIAENRTDAAFALNAAITEAKIERATCNVIRGVPFISPTQMADPYQAGSNVLMSRHIPYCGQSSFNGCGGGCGGGCNW